MKSSVEGSRTFRAARQMVAMAVAGVVAAGLLSARLWSSGSAPVRDVVICGRSLGASKVLGVSWPPGSPRSWERVPVYQLTRPQPTHTLRTFEPGPPVVLRFSSSCSEGVTLVRTTGVRVVATVLAHDSTASVEAARVLLLSRSIQSSDSLTFIRNKGGRENSEILRAQVTMTRP